MSATAPTLSCFWGTTPRRIKWFVQISFVLLAGSAIIIAILLFRDFVWKFNATYFANQAGCADAKTYYSRGSRRLLEIAVVDESGKSDVVRIPNMFETEPAGRQTDGLDIYFFYVSPSGGAPERITGESYVKGFNHWMRTLCANPDWFGPSGEPLPDSTQSNRPAFKSVPE
jgi:hypothetical protein